MRHAYIVEYFIVFDVFKRGMTGVAIILYSQQLLAEERKKFGIGRATIGARDLGLCGLFVCMSIHRNYPNLLPTAFHSDHGSDCVNSQRFVVVLKETGNSISKPLRGGMIFCR
jgi:hypothetical protein